MKKIILPLVILAFCSAQTMFAWGKRGHDSIAYIAECNLTPKAKATIEKYLGNRSIVYYSTWMDEYRRTPEYKYTHPWHTGGVDKNLKSTPEGRKPDGDAVAELEKAIATLKNYKKLDAATVNLNLKFVIHLAGDMHCPVHIKYPDIKMNFKVKMKGREMTYHAVWDSGLIEASHAWGYMEYRHQLDRYSNAERIAMSKGTPADWFHESAKDCVKIYDWAKPGADLGQDYINQAHELAEMQIVKAGYRLARTLNELFDN
ncbi:S1/P1 nuclease [Ereboglobus luteus]|uniref:S1/P1 Nuclease n=1 Tax=Ereboglobus luteus TaxID=1796921 RepID=A0A2U8E3C2_9BACT|nr:S1/P1 nuclease [Ereboglobus luteus]AWI09373.1 S1/P1 Nuclease [Ereboglobus luteus]